MKNQASSMITGIVSNFSRAPYLSNFVKRGQSFDSIDFGSNVYLHGPEYGAYKLKKIIDDDLKDGKVYLYDKKIVSNFIIPDYVAKQMHVFDGYGNLVYYSDVNSNEIVHYKLVNGNYISQARSDLGYVAKIIYDSENNISKIDLDGDDIDIEINVDANLINGYAYLTYNHNGHNNISKRNIVEEVRLSSYQENFETNTLKSDEKRNFGTIIKQYSGDIKLYDNSNENNLLVFGNKQRVISDNTLRLMELFINDNLDRLISIRRRFADTDCIECYKTLNVEMDEFGNVTESSSVDFRGRKIKRKFFYSKYNILQLTVISESDSENLTTRYYSGVSKQSNLVRVDETSNVKSITLISPESNEKVIIKVDDETIQYRGFHGDDLSIATFLNNIRVGDETSNLIEPKDVKPFSMRIWDEATTIGRQLGNMLPDRDWCHEETEYCRKVLRICRDGCMMTGEYGEDSDKYSWLQRCKTSCAEQKQCGNYVY